MTKPGVFTCMPCNYKSTYKSNFTKHLLTYKHKMLLDDKLMYTNCCVCGKTYKHIASLYRHKKICKQLHLQESKTTNELIHNLLKKNDELMAKIGEATVVNNITNIKNDTITFKIYLDSNCQNAVSLDWFGKNLNIGMEDYMTQLNKGYATGVGEVIAKNLSQIEFQDRPIHCTDIKNQKYYVKNDDWEVEDGGAVVKKLFPLVTATLVSNLNKIWEEEYGEDWSNKDAEWNEYSKTILILTQMKDTKKMITEKLKAMDYISEKIYVKMDQLLKE